MKKRKISIVLSFLIIVCIMANTVFAKSLNVEGTQIGEYGSFIDGDHIISDMIENSGQYGHPRLIMTEDRFAQLRSHIGDDTTTAVLLQKLRATADYEAKKGVVSYSTNLLENSKYIQRRVATFALAYNIFGDKTYAELAYRELENAASFPDWNPYHFLDCGEMCTAFAFGYDWLYNWMNEDQREVLRTAMIEKGLNQVLQDYEHKVVQSNDRGKRGDDGKRSYLWYEKYPGDNWKFVCIGGTNLAALAIGDEADAKSTASKVLDYGYKKAYTDVRAGYKIKDGSYAEGLGYWDYATYYLGFISSSLMSATGTDYGVADWEGVRKSADFVRYMSSNTPKSFSFGDDKDCTDTGWAVFLWLGSYFNSSELSNIRLRKIAGQSLNYIDVLWIDEDSQQGTGTIDTSTDWGSVGAYNASFRTSWDESGTVAALHVGDNNYKLHGHYDLGSFYLEYNGSRFFTDIGNEKDYNLYNRQKSYRIRAEGHNTLVINPTTNLDQVEGAECVITDFCGGNEAYAATDLTTAYKDSGAKSVVRSLKMIKDKNCVIVEDDISLNSEGEIYWFAHTPGQISVASDGKSAIVTVDSDRMWVGLISDDGKFTEMAAELLPTSTPVAGQQDNSAYRKLAIHLTNTKDTNIKVACIPLQNGETKPSWIPTEGEEPGAGEESSKYNISVVSGTSDKTEVEAGETVTLTASEPAEGKEFDKWVVNSGSVTLSKATSSTTTFTMPSEDVKVTATYKDKPVPTYNVTVSSGTANKTTAKKGDTVTVTANDPAEGEEFDKWVVNSGSVTLSKATSSTTTFTMPSEDVKVTATYKTVEKPQVTRYIITVNSGTANKTVAEAGETVTLTASEPAEGKEFDKWVVNSGEITLSNEKESRTTFVMPEGKVEVTAKFKDVEIQGNDPGTGEEEHGTGEKEPEEKEPEPVTKSTITFNLSGGTLNGETSFTVEAEVGSTITIPETVPVKEGYKFTYWKGSVYYPGDKYVVQENHTLTAQWEVDKKDDETKKDDKTSEVNKNNNTTENKVNNDNTAGDKQNNINTADNKNSENNSVENNANDNNKEVDIKQNDTNNTTVAEKPDTNNDTAATNKQENAVKENSDNTTAKNNGPATEDKCNPILWMVLMALSIVGITWVIEMKKRVEEEYWN